jgi:peptide/nickel transport system ATP-binding protein
MSAVPQPDPKAKKKRIVLQGEVPSPANPPSGCYFHPRCRYAQEICTIETPGLEEIRPGHFARCHFARELHLQGFVADSNGPPIPNQVKPRSVPIVSQPPMQAD